MSNNKIIKSITNQLLAKWFVCSLIPDSKSAKYGLRFSYPLYISIVFTGILLENPIILIVAVIIAFLGIKLPLHPFDYIYNAIAKLLKLETIPGRGTELQVNSLIAIIFNLLVIVLIILGVKINFVVMAMIYVASSIFFIGRMLLKK